MRVLYIHWEKAWNMQYETLAELADDVLAFRDRIVSRYREVVGSS